MFRALCSCLALTLLAENAWAKLEIREIQAVYGQLGPERKSLEMVPGDEIVFRFMVAGIRADEAGRVDGELRLQLAGPDGKVQLDEKQPVKRVLGFGGQAIPATASVRFGPAMALGDYNLTVTFRDNLSAESASFERKLTCKKLDFALVRFQFFHDPEGKLPAKAGGTLGQQLHFRLRAVGFDRSKGKLRLVMTLQVLDADGKPLMPKPVRVELVSDDAAQVANTQSVNFSGVLDLDRVGEFRLQVTVTDELNKRAVDFTTPLRVTAP